jgi:hypothetical protein
MTFARDRLIVLIAKSCALMAMKPVWFSTSPGTFTKARRRRRGRPLVADGLSSSLAAKDGAYGATWSSKLTAGNGWAE